MPDQAADQALFPPVIFSLHPGAVYVQAYYNVWFTVTLAFSILLLRPCFTIRESPPNTMKSTVVPAFSVRSLKMKF